MTVRERSITLDPGAPLPDRFEPGSMLVGVYRCEFTDFLYIRVRIGSFMFNLDLAKPPRTRAEAVALSREFIRAIDFEGTVRWQLGGAGAITDEPKL